MKFTETRPRKGVIKWSWSNPNSTETGDGNRGGALSHTGFEQDTRRLPSRRKNHQPALSRQITHWTLLKYSWGVLGGMEGSKPSGKSQGSTGNRRGINSSTADSAGTHAMVYNLASPTSRSRRRRTRLSRYLWRGVEPRAGLKGRNCACAKLLHVLRLRLQWYSRDCKFLAVMVLKCFRLLSLLPPVLSFKTRERLRVIHFYVSLVVRDP